MVVLDSDIRQAVIGQGFADCSIVRQYVKPRPESFGDDGTWYCLFAKHHECSPFELWGRRRTLAELLDMAKRGPAY